MDYTLSEKQAIAKELLHQAEQSIQQCYAGIEYWQSLSKDSYYSQEAKDGYIADYKRKIADWLVHVQLYKDIIAIYEDDVRE